MRRFHSLLAIGISFVIVSGAFAGDWQQFRGPGGLGVSDEKGLATEWSAEKNIAWKVKLPGAGASCPITHGKHVFVTCYSGYGMDTQNPGNMDDLRRHLVCLDKSRSNASIAVSDGQLFLRNDQYLYCIGKR